MTCTVVSTLRSMTAVGGGAAAAPEAAAAASARDSAIFGLSAVSGPATYTKCTQRSHSKTFYCRCLTTAVKSSKECSTWDEV